MLSTSVELHPALFFLSFLRERSLVARNQREAEYPDELPRPPQKN
jgi:hypothetical protein